MKQSAAILSCLALVAIILLCWIAYGVSHPTKRRATHYQGVNTFRSAMGTDRVVAMIKAQEGQPFGAPVADPLAGSAAVARKPGLFARFRFR